MTSETWVRPAAVIVAIVLVWLVFRLVRGKTRYVLAPALAGVVLLAGCSLYHHKYDVVPVSPDDGYAMHVVQLDDFGSFWDLPAAQRALDEVKSGAASGNEIVVLFIHGWHHSANPDDPEGNLASFRDAMRKLAAELATEPFRRARQQLTGDEKVRLVAIYVGWRGRSLPGLLDYGTAWWRKDAAERVGSGDLSEFMTRLQRTYRDSNAFVPSDNGDPRKPFMGLVTIGHSFGGQVLLKSVAPRLEEQFVDVTEKLADTAAQVEASERVVNAPIHGFGDLNVLLNPALEAHQFARIQSLYRQRAYPSNQTPQLVVFSADNDWARQSFFPIARALTSPFRPRFRNSQQAAEWSQALGELESQRTHRLTLSKEPDTITTAIYDEPLPSPLSTRDFTDHIVFSGVALDPDPAVRVPNSPIEVVYTYDHIIDGHNGIFQDQFRSFLGKYIAFIEGKGLVARFEERKDLLDKRATERTTAPPR